MVCAAVVDSFEFLEDYSLTVFSGCGRDILNLNTMAGMMIRMIVDGD